MTTPGNHSATLRRRRLRRRQVLRDLGYGLGTFLLLMAVLGAPSDTWTLSRASAADHLAARAIAATSPPSAGSENAVLGAVLHGARPLQRPQQPTAMIVLGLTFTLIFAFNLAFWRHLRRVYASPRRGEWRRGR
ncbi:MAG: hypothetical protein ACKVP7_22955 [Hyphomicrobiaceae bacterium]